MNPPLAFCRLEPAGHSYLWIVMSCPLCGRQHTHGGGPIASNPREQLGHRLAHCRVLSEESSAGYVLVEARSRNLKTQPLRPPTSCYECPSTSKEYV